jgi:AAHS family 4-hydroxybenzoate transporter-like MFS transporter
VTPATPLPDREDVDLDALLDHAPWRAYHTLLIALTALTIVFDGIDNQLLGIVMPTIMKEWDLPRAAFAPAVSSAYLGMGIGAALAGLAGDRFGRRNALLASMVIFGAMTIAVASSHSVATLGWLRLLAGIGLGGAMPNAASLAAEYSPRRRRPVAVTATIVCVPLGAMFAGLLGIQALPAFGWRALFIAGGAVPIVAAALLWTVMPESPHFLLRHRRWRELATLLRRMGHHVADTASFKAPAHAAVSRAPFTAVLAAAFRRDTLSLWGAFYSCLLAVYLGFSWLPTLLTGAGFSPSFASQGITAFNLGGVVGALVGSIIISRLGSRLSMLTMTAAALAGAVTLAFLPLSTGNATTILALLTLTGGLINAAQTTMYALATHVYPVSVRATGVGTASAVGRLGAITSGYAGAWAIGLDGSRSYFGLIAVAMAMCFVCLALISRHVERRRA